MGRILGVLLLVAFTAIPSSTSFGLPSGEDPENASIVRIVQIDDDFRGQGGGSGFIVSSDGTTLTNAHVVYRVAKEPSKYRLIALRGREWYGASLICSTKLPYDYDPEKNSPNVPFTKDVAVAKLAPPQAKKRWGYPLPGGLRYDYEPHQGPMPEFQTFRLADRGPGIGLAIHTTGFSTISALPRLFTTTGAVTRTFSGGDGTQIFEMEFPNPTQRGASGSPILDSSGQVVGINAWGVNVGARGNKAWGVGVSALHRPCGDVTL